MTEEEQAILDRTERARESLERERDNLRAQIMYISSEVATALHLPLQTPAGTVQSVRDLAAIAKSGEEARRTAFDEVINLLHPSTAPIHTACAAKLVRHLETIKTQSILRTA